MKTYEITVECTNGDWRWWRIEARDFQAACENAMQSIPTWKGDAVLDGARLVKIECLSSLPDGVMAVSLEDPAELHNTFKRIFGE